MPAPKDGRASEPAARRRAEDRAALETLKRGDRAQRAERLAATRHLLSSTRGALWLLEEIDGGRRAGIGRSRRGCDRAASATVEVRDLFERFSRRGERALRLGDVVRPRGRPGPPR